MKRAYPIFANFYLRIQNGIVKFKKNKKGMGTIEIMIIIAVLVALALIFRKFIVELATNIFSTIQKNAETAIQE